MKKALLFIVVTIISISMVVVFSLSGCKKEAVPAEEEAVEEAAPAEEAAEEVEEEAVEEEKEPIVITVWDWQAGSAFDEAMVEINALYNEMNPNVTID